MAEELYREYPMNVNGKDIVFFTNDGLARPESDFNAARLQYRADGTTPAGFSPLEKGSIQQVLRSGYEYVNTPLQKFGAQQGQVASESQEYITKGGQQFPMPLAPDMQAKAGIKAFAESVSTPERAGVTAALGATTLGPVGQVLRNTSGPLPSIVRALTGYIGSLGATKLTGTDVGESIKTPIMDKATTKALLTIPSILAAEGMIGLVTKGVSSKAKLQIVDDIVSAIHKEAPHLRYQGKYGIDEYIKTKGGFTNVIKAGIKGLKNDGDDLAQDFLADLKYSAGIHINKKTTALVERMLKKYDDAVVEMLDDIGNVKARSSGLAKIDEISLDIKNAIVKSIGPPDKIAPQYLASIQQVMSKYGAEQQKFKALAEVFGVLKESNISGGFDSSKLQHLIADRLKPDASGMPLSQLSDDVMTAASRGAPHGSTDFEGININRLPEWAWKTIGISKPRIPVGGTYHVGEVRGLPPKAAFDAATQNEIRKFLFREDK